MQAYVCGDVMRVINLYTEGSLNHSPMNQNKREYFHIVFETLLPLKTDCIVANICTKIRLRPEYSLANFSFTFD